MEIRILRHVRYSPVFLDNEATSGVSQLLKSPTAILSLLHDWEISLVSRHGIRFHFRSTDCDQIGEDCGETAGYLAVSETEQGDVIVEGTYDAFAPDIAERIDDFVRIEDLAPLSDAAQINNGRPTLAMAADLLSIDITDLLPRIANRTNSKCGHDCLLGNVIIRADCDPLSCSVDLLTLATWAFLERASQSNRALSSVGSSG